MHLLMGAFLGLICMAILPLAPASAATLLTGDRIDGTPVIEKLDVADLPAGALSRFYFRVTDQSAGQGWYVPVIVAKGARPGPRLLLTAAIHGDELNGIAIIQDLIPTLDLAALKGTIVAVPGLNMPGILAGTRNFGPGQWSAPDNLNRLMPGDVAADDVAKVYAGRLWSRIFQGNADAAVDMHTQSRGSAYPMYVFAETPGARRLAQALRPDMIKYDPGVKGAVETTLNAAGITAVTMELGEADRFDPAMIRRGLKGLRNVMIDLGMTSGAQDLSGPDPYVGNKAVDVTAPRGGYARILVSLGAEVEAGEPVATISDPFGRVVYTATAPVKGRVLSLATAPTREIGSLLVRILSWSDDPACQAEGCGG
jgi:predicted deacylase